MKFSPKFPRLIVFFQTRQLNYGQAIKAALNRAHDYRAILKKNADDHPLSIKLPLLLQQVFVSLTYSENPFHCHYLIILRIG